MCDTVEKLILKNLKCDKFIPWTNGDMKDYKRVSGLLECFSHNIGCIVLHSSVGFITLIKKNSFLQIFVTFYNLCE